jgi:hypothetical protein
MIFDSATLKRIFRAVVIGVVLILVVFGFLVYLDERKVKLNWSEEALLSSNKSVVVDVRGRYEKLWYPGTPVRYRIHDITLSVRASDVSPAPRPFRGKLRPVLIDRGAESSEWIIVVAFDYCDDWFAMGRPMPPFLQYRYRDSTWSPTPFGEELLDRPVDFFFVNPSRLPLLQANDFNLTLRTKEIWRDRPLLLRELASKWPGNC